MKVKLNKGKTAEEVFGISDKKADSIMKFLMDIIEDDIDNAVEKIYAKARNSKELGYMLMYYTSLLHTIAFDNFMDDSVEGEMETQKSSDEGMYW